MRAQSAATFNPTGVIKTVIRLRSGQNGAGSLADRLFRGNAGYGERVREKIRRPAVPHRHVNAYSLYCPANHANLLAWIIAGVTSWLV
jgi:hypothetical protein